MVNADVIVITKEEIPHDHLFKVTGLSSTNLEKMDKEPTHPADFETAIAHSGYGRFNIFLMSCCLPAFFAMICVTTSTSFIFVRAKCDMQLSLLDMGTINAITYGGMISSAMVWGFLSDTLGRKPIMVFGFLVAGLAEVTSALSQNFAMLLTTRFLCGFLFNGPLAILLSYLAEMHRTEYRAKVMLFANLFYTIASVVLPFIAYAILTHDWTIYIFGGSMVLRSWNIFMLTTALVPILTGLLFSLLPESPKFLMSRGRNEEAMKMFKIIYTWNTGKHPDTFPVRSLVVEKTEQMAQGVAALRGGFAQVAPLFKRPHGLWLILMCFLNISCMFGSNTLRLWYPQLAAMIESSNGTSLCDAIAPDTINITHNITDLTLDIMDVTEEFCEQISVDINTYIHSAIVGAGSVVTFTIGGFLINTCGKKVVAGVSGLTCALVIILLPVLGSSSSAVVSMFTLTMALTSLIAASLSSIVADLFPTSLRVMAMATYLMTGRAGTMTGTIVFPALISYGCYPPFITISLVIAVCGTVCFVVPNTTLKKLE